MREKLFFIACLMIVSFGFLVIGMKIRKERVEIPQQINRQIETEKNSKMSRDVLILVIKGLVKGTGLPLKIVGEDDDSNKKSRDNAVSGVQMTGQVMQGQAIQSLQGQNNEVVVEVEKGKEKEVLLRYKDLFDLVYRLSLLPQVKVRGFCIGEECNGFNLRLEIEG